MATLATLALGTPTLTSMTVEVDRLQYGVVSNVYWGFLPILRLLTYLDTHTDRLLFNFFIHGHLHYLPVHWVCRQSGRRRRSKKGILFIPRHLTRHDASNGFRRPPILYPSHPRTDSSSLTCRHGTWSTTNDDDDGDNGRGRGIPYE